MSNMDFKRPSIGLNYQRTLYKISSCTGVPVVFTAFRLTEMGKQIATLCKPNPVPGYVEALQQGFAGSIVFEKSLIQAVSPDAS